MTDLAVSLAGSIGQFNLAAQFSVPARGITGLFGPSGSGKTSILRCIAGLTRLPQARIAFEDSQWQDGVRFVPAEQRGAVLVFQDGALFPHLDVRGNLAYAMRRAPAGPALFDGVVEMLDLGPLLPRGTSRLSGGERQRVAIARALLAQPRLLLLDEPVSALDHSARDEIIAALFRLSAELELPMLYVSHDLAELARIADHLVLLVQGRVIGAGPTTEVLADLSLPLASLPHALSVLSAQVRSYDPASGVTHLAIDGEEWLIPGRIDTHRSECRLRVMASDVGMSRTAPPHTTILNMPLARIVDAAPMMETGQVNVLLRLGPDGTGQSLLARISRKSWETLRFQPGECVHLLIKGVGLVEPD